MKNKMIRSTKLATKYWWSSLLVGICAIIAGIWSLTSPAATLIALIYVFIVAFFFSGIFDIAYAVSNKNLDEGWGWTLAGGIIDILFGIILIAMPKEFLAGVFVYFVGFWIMFRSIWTMGIAFDLQRYMHAGWLLVLSVLGLIFSIFYLLSPVFNGVFIVVLVALAFISYGIFRIYYAFRLKEYNKNISDLEKDNEL